jgi:hypothetical protein
MFIAKTVFITLKKDNAPTSLDSHTCKSLLMHENFHLDKSAVGIARHAIWNSARKACDCTGFFTEICQLLEQKTIVMHKNQFLVTCYEY